MLYLTIKRQIEKNGLDDALRNKIDILFVAGRLTEAEYNSLVSMGSEV